MTADEPRQSAGPRLSVMSRSAPAGSDVAGPRPSAATPAAPKARPDPRPMRLAMGAGTIAAVSIMAAGLVRFPVPTGEGSGAAEAADAQTIETLATARPAVRVKHRTVYVHLKPGQRAPDGAKVIDGKAPPARVVVSTIPGKAATTRSRPTTRRVVVTKTRQSGG